MVASSNGQQGRKRNEREGFGRGRKRRERSSWIVKRERRRARNRKEQKEDKKTKRKTTNTPWKYQTRLLRKKNAQKSVLHKTSFGTNWCHGTRLASENVRDLLHTIADAQYRDGLFFDHFPHLWNDNERLKYQNTLKSEGHRDEVFGHCSRAWYNNKRRSIISTGRRGGKRNHILLYYMGLS